MVELERLVETEYTTDFVVFDDSGMETVTFVVVAWLEVEDIVIFDDEYVVLLIRGMVKLEGGYDVLLIVGRSVVFLAGGYVVLFAKGFVVLLPGGLVVILAAENVLLLAGGLVAILAAANVVLLAG